MWGRCPCEPSRSFHHAICETWDKAYDMGNINQNFEARISLSKNTCFSSNSWNSFQTIFARIKKSWTVEPSFTLYCQSLFVSACFSALLKHKCTTCCIALICVHTKSINLLLAPVLGIAHTNALSVCYAVCKSRKWMTLTFCLCIVVGAPIHIEIWSRMRNI